MTVHLLKCEDEKDDPVTWCGETFDRYACIGAGILTSEIDDCDCWLCLKACAKDLQRAVKENLW